MTNEVQHLTIVSNPTGSFALSLDTVPSDLIPAKQLTADDLSTALEAMSNIGPGNVFVTKLSVNNFDIEFVNDLGDQDISTLVPDNTHLSSGTAEISVVTEGAPEAGPPPGGNIGAYFPVTGYWVSVESAAADSITNDLAVEPVTGLVTFFPRLPQWTSIPVAQLVTPGGPQDTGVVLAPVEAQILDGYLCTINAEDTPGVQLVANADALGLTDPLIYDVDFSQIVYAGGPQDISNFGFEAPQDVTPVCLTDPALVRLDYNGPIPGGKGQ